MLKIRLARRGKKRQPTYRVVVADVESPRDGRFVEQIGHYNPMVDPIDYRIKEERALHWLSVGAQPTDAVRRLLDKQGTYDRLSRLRGGEEFGALVAEYEGVPWPPVVEVEEEDDSTGEAEDEGIIAQVVDTVEDVVEDVQEAVSGAIASVMDFVSGDDDEAETEDGDSEEEDAADEASDSEESADSQESDAE